MSKRPRRSPAVVRRAARAVALGATVLAVAASGASALLASGAHGDPARSTAQQQRLKERSSAHRTLARAARAAPLAVGGRCRDTRVVPGQGRSCRTRDGMYLVPRADGAPLLTHGPDIVAAAPRTARAGGFGSATAAVCSPASRSRHVALLYLLPSDFANGAAAVHGDRYAEVADQLRQALWDAASVVDTRAGQLAGQRRRLRVLCDDDGRPTVERVVLPKTSAQYLAASSGFVTLGDDLEALGHLPEYDGFSARRLPAVRRVLAYYDADFHAGYAGQGTMFRRSSLLGQGMRPADPLISRTTRNINNNPPSASLAIQYGTRDHTGAPDPPTYTSLLHELAHTMGAVQDEPPTSSDAGHCVDGLDIMCYEDSPGSTYSDTACPDAAPPRVPEDEQFDCNGDTYFHPAPPAGHPLADARTWQLGLAANETMATGDGAVPAAVAGLVATGSGTRRTLRWSPVAGVSGYEVAWRRSSGPWQHEFVTRPVAQPALMPRTGYELRVGAVSTGLAIGPRAMTSLRTGLDNSPPAAPRRVSAASVLRTSLRLRYVHPADNVRVTRLRIERRSGVRWTTHVVVVAPRRAVAGARVLSPAIGRLRPGTRYQLRIRALDARGNASAPSAGVTIRMRR